MSILYGKFDFTAAFLNYIYIKYKAGCQMDRQNVIIKLRKER